MTRASAITLNAVGLYAVALVLVAAFAAQLMLDELPCPLCLLQRLQFAVLAIGPILLLYLVLQRYIVSGLTTGSLKG